MQGASAEAQEGSQAEQQAEIQAQDEQQRSAVRPPRPTSPPGARYIAQISSGGSHNCALWSDGKIECWGANQRGQSDVPSGSFLQVDAGYEHTCALTDDYAIQCWGSNEFGELNAPEGGFWSMVSAGRGHSCAGTLRERGSVVCWGSSQTGQLNGPNLIDGNAVQVVSAGSGHSCAITWSGLECWGYDEFGQSTTENSRFTRNYNAGGAADTTTDASVEAGAGHTCVLSNDGQIECWGRNEFGQADEPVGSFQAVSAGGLHTCALDHDGGVQCWGTNTSAQNNVPAGWFTKVSAGWYHTCAVREEGGAVCWGGNDNGQAVAPTSLANAAPAPPPTDNRPAIEITKDVRSFGVGARHTCATSTDDEAWCWGSNDAGQIAPPDRPLRWLDIGADYSCALTSDGEPVCWGSRWTQAKPCSHRC